MRITPVRNINFSGNFRSNMLLDAVIDSSNNYELKRFADILNRMESVSDYKSYVLDTRYNYDVETKELFLRDNTTKKFYKSIAGWKIEEKAVFNKCLERINNFLESVYPPQKITDIPRQTLLKKIRNKLV